MKNVKDMDLFLVVWCTVFAIYEGYCLANGIGIFGVHLIGFAIQFGVLCMTIRSVIVVIKAEEESNENGEF